MGFDDDDAPPRCSGPSTRGHASSQRCETQPGRNDGKAMALGSALEAAVGEAAALVVVAVAVAALAEGAGLRECAWPFFAGLGEGVGPVELVPLGLALSARLPPAVFLALVIAVI